MTTFLPAARTKSKKVFPFGMKNAIAKRAAAAVTEWAGSGTEFGSFKRVAFCEHDACTGAKKLCCQAQMLQKAIFEMCSDPSTFSNRAALVRVFLGHDGPELTTCHPPNTSALKDAWEALFEALRQAPRKQPQQPQLINQAAGQTPDQQEDITQPVVLAVGRYAEFQVAKDDLLLHRRWKYQGRSCSSRKDAFYYLPLRLQSNLQVAVFAAQCDSDSRICQWLPESFKDNVHLMKAMLTKDVNRYTFMTEAMRLNEDVCLHAMTCNLEFFACIIDRRMKVDRNPHFMRKAAGIVQRTCHLFPPIALDRNFWQDAVAQTPQLLRLVYDMVDQQTSDKQAVIHNELNRNGLSLQWVKELQVVFDTCVLAVKQNLEALQFVDASIREQVAHRVKRDARIKLLWNWLQSCMRHRKLK